MKLIFLFLLPLALGMEPEAEPEAEPEPQTVSVEDVSCPNTGRVGQVCQSLSSET
eukprot:SAG11_NODE_3953_length_2134_cov_5.636364_1_plen_55_part_00